jgi:hypothetical protein
MLACILCAICGEREFRPPRRPDSPLFSLQALATTLPSRTPFGADDALPTLDCAALSALAATEFPWSHHQLPHFGHPHDIGVNDPRVMSWS